MISETSARVAAVITAGAEYTLKGRNRGQPDRTIVATRTRTLIWDRGSSTAWLHDGCNGVNPLEIAVSTTGPTNGASLMGFLREWIARLPESER